MTTEQEVSAVTDFLQVMKQLYDCKMTVVEKCVMVSSLAPDKWEECVLWPQYGTDVVIFGDNQVAMARENSINILEALVWCGLCESNGEARKAIRNSGIKLNRKTVTDFRLMLTKEHALPNLDAIVLEFGKYNFGIIELC